MLCIYLWSQSGEKEWYVVLGDFNARAGSREGDGERWYAIGPHGHGCLNEVSKELLSFLSSNEATVFVTPGFRKRK